FGCISVQGISTWGRDGASGDKQSGAGDVSAFNSLLDANVTVAGTLRFNVPKRGEALLQGTPDRNRGARCTQRERIFQDVDVVSALGWVFALQENVRMRIDKAGKHSSAGEVNQRCPGGSVCAGVR